MIIEVNDFYSIDSNWVKPTTSPLRGTPPFQRMRNLKYCISTVSPPFEANLCTLLSDRYFGFTELTSFGSVLSKILTPGPIAVNLRGNYRNID